ncbi:hypothetical protein OVA24_16285 [Luteolibacter sp. SL250]|uniref:ELWxxDGT repeat protein n=1 Tax=Luteolibacter sp. SL250 TaxID=2995170 RepID=UPI00226E9DBC|nr:ELWxxDGT repeat protein [Luteolibacter sp. SL250]WAC18789.1 hypothetical protein OVA24_16285 [Luteolibacter sp. SL250]
MNACFPLTSLLTACGLSMATAQEIPERLTSLSHAAGSWNSYDGGVMMGDMLYYSRRTVTHGEEVWKTDGTAEGTRLVWETIVGTDSSLPNARGVADGNQLYFGSHQTSRIWRTDGTAAGTVTTFPRWPSWSYMGRVRFLSRAPGGGALFISGPDYSFEEDRAQLWKTDGTQEGTVLLAADYLMEDVQVAGGTIWCGGHRLWKSDGTPAGTVAAFTPTPAYLDTRKMVWAMTDDTVLFTTSRDGTPMLHRLDAGGVTALKETGTAVSDGSRPVFLEGDVHFLTSGTTGLQLWRSDGTEDGTTLVKTMPGTPSHPPLPITAAGGKIYFNAAPEGQSVDRDLWVSDGTEAGTLPLMRTNASSPTAFGDRLYFLHATAEGKRELWTTDGTVAGTVTVADLGPSSANPQIRMGATASALILAGNSTVWRSDGTPGGTMAAPVGRMLAGKPINGITSMPAGQVLFSAHDTAMGRRLWKSDGTAAGTVLVEAGPPGVEGFKSIGLGGAVMLDGVRYFTADDGVHGNELWRSDGTAEGTGMVKDFLPGKESSQPQSLTVFKGEVWFTAVHSHAGRKVWRTDGTEAGTRVEMDAGGGLSYPAVTLSIGWQGNLVVRASGSPTLSLDGIWWTDGTPEGTGRLTQDELPPTSILKHGGLTYYMVGDDLWRTDGTAAGKELLHRFPAGVHLIPAGREVLALGIGSGGMGQAAYSGLWRIPADGPLVRLRAFNNYGSTGVLGGVAHFSVTSPAVDAGLWRSDGTVEGTYRLAGVGASGDIKAHAGKLYFCGNDGVHGEEPWVSDGTVEGTRMLVDLTGDSGGSSPARFTPAGGKVFFAATTEAEGPQLYVLDTGGAPAPYAAWLDVHRPWMDGRTGRGDDADEDGFTNLQEFAFGGDPSDGAARPVISPALLAVSSVNGVGTHLSLTVPVRRGTVFTPGRPATGVADGVGYRILATEDLGGPVDPAALLEVQEDATVPPPPHPHEDYEYRTFRLVETLSARERAFLRVVTE